MNYPGDLTPAQIKREIIHLIDQGVLFADSQAVDCGASVQVLRPNGQRLVILVIDSISRWNSMDEWKENPDG